MVSLSIFRKKQPALLPKDPGLLAPPTFSPPRSPSKSNSFTSILNQYEDSLATLSASLNTPPVRPPRLNTDEPILTAPASPSSRRLVSEQKYLSAGFVRHSRVLSGSSTTASAAENFVLPLQSLRHRLHAISADLPQELLPVVNLINAQRLRQYAAGPLLMQGPHNTWVAADAVLAGTELSLFAEGAAKPKYMNVQDCSVLTSLAPAKYDITILQDFDNALYNLRFSDPRDMYMWLGALQLAKFEHTSLNEAFTAVILSLKGPELSDIYTLLAHKKRFPRFEWCNLRLPQVSLKWLRVYMAIMPGEGKKKGRVEVYTSDKINKKTLVLYVNDADAVYNVYPENHHMIDFNLIMKLEGQVFVNKNFEQLFTHEHAALSKAMSREHSLASLSSFVPPNSNRSRSASVNSSASFFVNAPSPSMEVPSAVGSPPRSTSHFFKKQSASHFVTTNYLYLMPVPHPGVKAIEIMIRNFIHIVDAFKLYGRPNQLSSDKRDSVSMLFGLPSLPHYGYLSTEDAYTVVEANFDTARLNMWDELQWRNCFKQYLSCKQQDGPFKGVENISELYDSVDSPSSAPSMQLPDVYSAQIALPHYESGSKSPLKSPGQGYGETFGDVNDSRLENDGPFLGRPLEFQPNRLSDPRALQMPLNYLTQDEVLRSLEPIVDLPTPLDDKLGVSYFPAKDDKAIVVTL